MIAGKVFTFLFVFFCFVAPFHGFLQKASVGFTDFNFIGLLLSPIVIHLLMKTVSLVASTLILILVLSFLFSFAMHLFLKHRPTAAQSIKFLLSVYWVLPSLVFVIITWKLLRSVGLGEWLYSYKAILVGWVLGLTPFVTLGLNRVFADFDPRESEAARTLGANPLKLFQTIYFPRLLPAAASLSMQSAWLMITSFSLVVVLGGGSPNDTIETSIYQSIRTFDIRHDRAFALSLWQAILMGLLYYARNRMNQKIKVGVEWTHAKSIQLSMRSWGGIGLVLVLFIYLLLLLFGSGTNKLMLPWLQSFVIAFASSIITLFCSFIFYQSGRVVSELGAVVSPIVLSLMWWESYAHSLSPWLLCVGVQVVLFLPWVSRNLYPLLDRKRKLEIEAAQTLGASPLHSWFTVEWPRLYPELKITFAWLMAFSLAEVSSVILFSKGEFEPLSVWAQNQMSRFRFEEGFLGVKLVVITTVVLILLASFTMPTKRKTA